MSGRSFESGVILYGNQAVVVIGVRVFKFESGVILYGNQAH